MSSPETQEQKDPWSSNSSAEDFKKKVSDLSHFASAFRANQ